jgi:ketosteroid isomerase-like protein
MRTVAPLFGTRLTALAAQCVVVALMSLSVTAVRADEVADVQKLLSSGKNVEALQKADQFLAAKPKDPMMRFLRGISLSQAGRTAEAITAFQKLTEDFPELPEPFNNLAVLYAQQGQYDKSRTALEMAIRTNPSYATAYENLGDVYAKLASQAYSKALQIDTRSAVAPKLAMIRDLFPKDRAGGAVAALTTGKPAATTPAVVAPPVVPVTPPTPVAPPVKPPVTTPTTPPVVPPAPPVVPPTAPVADAQVKAIESAVRVWAAAWAAKDMDSYYEAYADDFKGDKGSRKSWEQERRERITSKRKISVKVSDIDVTVNGNKATARFRQEYKADSLDISSGKRMDFNKVGSEWLIVKESSGS